MLLMHDARYTRVIYEGAEVDHSISEVFHAQAQMLVDLSLSFVSFRFIVRPQLLILTNLAHHFPLDHAPKPTSSSGWQGDNLSADC